MEHELVDEGHQRIGRRAPHEAADHQAGAGLPLGNAALTRLLGGRAAVNRRATASQGAGPLDPEIAEQIDAARGAGSALPDDVRIDMETHLGADLSGVRVHTDARASDLNRAVQAQAFTTGSDVFFSPGTFAPGTTDGRRLLGHELTHVVQQSTGAAGGESRVSDPSDPHEREAAAVGDAIASSPVAVQRSEDDEELDDM
jgi:hypothetical protein